MKKVYGLLIAFIACTAAMAQPTPHEKDVLRNDLARERDKRHEVARDIFRGNPEKARADNHAALAYHAKIHRDIHQVQRNDVARHASYHPRPHHYARPHRPYHPHYYAHHHKYYGHPHAKVVVTVRH